jgi:hypothetical protein
MYNNNNERQITEDIKRILIDRDITTLKQAFCRILCSEKPSNKELGFGRQVYESEDYAVYNTIIGVVISVIIK